MKCTPLYHLDTFVEQGPFQHVSMDLITDLPPLNKYNSILTIVDQGCFKAAKFIPCNKTIDGQGVAGDFLFWQPPPPQHKLSVSSSGSQFRLVVITYSTYLFPYALQKHTSTSKQTKNVQTPQRRE